ncbi:MAG: YraN family protein [Proteobacteria bacterium]|nr:MAG: YraN family protein [Pseudomonadota bacterium]PIE17908.1 MAG: YraN family protein [Pseudomonadota bacterium]
MNDEPGSPDDASSRDGPVPTDPSRTELGRRAERLAAQLLLREGYRLLDRNYRIQSGEIDLIAEEDQILCFVEVRSRQNTELGHPLETINHRKRRRLLRAADHYLATQLASKRPPFTRFDVISVVYEPKLEVRLVRDAFDATRY